MPMTRTPLLATALAATVLLSACSGSKKEEDAPKVHTTQDALNTTATPFTIGSVTIGEMGATPRGEIDDDITDPYSRMARTENASEPVVGQEDPAAIGKDGAAVAP
jgi:PBP1b-binding outer membrane lipoprotein LpoB